MPLDPKAEAAKRKAMAAVFEKTQREMASAVDELAVTRRLPVPYQSNEPIPPVTLPYPQDSHLIRSIELVPQRKLPFFVAADSAQNPCSGGKPWASFNPSVPSVLANREPSQAAPTVAKPSTDEEMWRTRHNEWTLQKNAYNPDIASQMRCAEPAYYVAPQPSATAPPTRCVQAPPPSSRHPSVTLSQHQRTQGRLAYIGCECRGRLRQAKGKPNTNPTLTPTRLRHRHRPYPLTLPLSPTPTPTPTLEGAHRLVDQRRDRAQLLRLLRPGSQN